MPVASGKQRRVDLRIAVSPATTFNGYANSIRAWPLLLLFTALLLPYVPPQSIGLGILGFANFDADLAGVVLTRLAFNELGKQSIELHIAGIVEATYFVLLSCPRVVGI